MYGDSELMRGIFEELDFNKSEPLLNLSLVDIVIPIYGFFHHANKTESIKE